MNFWQFGFMLLYLLVQVRQNLGSLQEENLMVFLFNGYNHLIRPVESVNSSAIITKFSLALILLINVDEKNQIMQTNVWLTMKWMDYQMRWTPDQYGGIKTIRIPPDKVWLPDIVLFNNADGNYEVSFYSNVVVENTGAMLWVPPAIYKSSCTIDVEYFPFDEQTCQMIFGSWTFSGLEVKIDYLDQKTQVELNDYSHSGIWDVIDVPGELIEDASRIRYAIKIRRKTLFYTVILIIPTVLMAFLSMMVFYLPADASEKITLAISILLALVVFLLLVSKILPPTSTNIPLMAKYLLLTFVMNIVTILVTVIIINVYFRGPTTHQMPPWVRRVFLRALPNLLMMRRPYQHNYRASQFHSTTNSSRTPTSAAVSRAAGAANQRLRMPIAQSPAPLHHTNSPVCNTGMPSRHHSTSAMQVTEYWPNPSRTGGSMIPAPSGHQGGAYHSLESNCITHSPITGNMASSVASTSGSHAAVHQPLLSDMDTELRHRNPSAEVVVASNRLSPEAYKAMEAIEYITEHLKQDDEYKKVRDDWKYVAMVIDRLLLYIFFGVTMGGTLGILLSAPNVFDHVDQAAIILRLQAQQSTTPPP